MWGYKKEDCPFITIKQCNCGSNNIGLYHRFSEDYTDLKIWVECEHCKKTSTNAFKTLVDALYQWNKEN
jgi:hypothetical protein